MRRLAPWLALLVALHAPARAAVPLHDRVSCPDCSNGVNPHAPLLRGEGDFEPDPTMAALRRLGVDLKKSRPLPGSVATRQPAAPEAPAAPVTSDSATPAPPATARATAVSVAVAAPVAAAASPADKPTAKPTAPTVVSGYTVVSFGELAGFTLPHAGTKQPLAEGTAPPDVAALLPAAVRKLDGKKVLVTGFMLPTKLEEGFGTEFFLFSSPLACCFGTTPAAHEWIAVKMRKKGLPAVQHVPIPLAGRLRVRPQWDRGTLIGLYELEGDGLLNPKL
jgi:hypothetical protein